MVNDLKNALINNKIEIITDIIDAGDLSKKHIKILRETIDKNNFLLVLDRLLDNNLLDKVYSEKFVINKLKQFNYSPYDFSKYTLLKLMEREKFLNYFIENYSLNIIIDLMKTHEDYENLFELLLSKYTLTYILENCNINNLARKKKIIKVLIDKICERDLEISDDDENFLNEICSDFSTSYIILKFKYSIPLQSWNNFIKFYKKTNYEGDIIKLLSFFKKYPELCCYFSEQIDENEKVLIQLDDARYHDLDVAAKLVVPEIVSVKKHSEFFKTAQTILKASGKVNTSDANPNFDQNFITYIPQIGLENTMDLLKYDTIASLNIIKLIKEKKLNEVLDFINLYQKYDILPFGSKAIHYAFRYYDSYSILINDLKGRDLTKDDIKAIRHLILTRNKFNIISYEQLKNYESFLKNKLHFRRDAIAEVYGYISYDKLLSDFNGYNVSSISLFKKIYEDLKKADSNYKFPFTKEEMSLIKSLLILSTRGEQEYFIFIQEHLNKGYSIYFNDVFRVIITKIKNLFEDYYNMTFTDISKLNDCKKRKYHGVEIIELKDKPFSFLVHQLKGWDSSFDKYPDMLMDNPSLWSRLEGATTLSTSHISEKCLKHVDGESERVRYLFNHINRHTFMYMSYEDLMVSHGGHVINPGYDYLDVMLPDSLDFKTMKYSYRDYNELVLERDNSKPCAIWSLNYIPTDKEVRSAKSFNVPIIYINPRVYNERASIAKQYYVHALLQDANWYSLKEAYLHSGGNEKDVRDLVNILDKKLNNKVISFDVYRNLLRKLCVQIENTYNPNAIGNILKCYLNLREILCYYNHDANLEFDYNNNLSYKIMVNKKPYLLSYVSGMGRKEGIDGNEIFCEYDLKRALEIEALFKLRQKLNITTYKNCEFLDKTKKVLIQDYDNLRQSKTIYDDINAKNIIEEWILGNLVEGDSCYICETNFRYKENALKLIEKILEEIIRKNQSTGETYVVNENVFEYLYNKLLTGELNSVLYIIEDLLLKLEGINDEEYIEIFKDLIQFKNNPNNYKKELLEGKAIFISKTRRLINDVKGQSRKLATKLPIE